MTKRAVLYSVNTKSLYLRLVLQSIQSLRAVSPRIPIFLVVYGSLNEQQKGPFSSLNIKLICESAMPQQAAESLKWFALSKVQEFSEVLFVDADTVFIDPVEFIFDRHQNADFYAFPEFATGKRHKRGDNWIPRRDRPQIMKALRLEFNSKEIPIFNSSLMLFRNSLVKDIVRDLPLFSLLFWQFHNKTREFPCVTIFMVDEITGALILGRNRGRKIKKFKPGTVTHFNDWILNWDTNIGHVVHIGHGALSDFVELFGFGVK